uniref:Uncharacterized protein LOC105115454 n=1 Tax=Rhizophora mucronata TaxID=61149 RepID=A0A2P2JSD5_RHIMU
MFLTGLERLGKGDWRGISRNFVTTRTPTQVASHAQKYFLRHASLNKKRRSSLFDMVRSSNYRANPSDSNPTNPAYNQSSCTPNRGTNMTLLSLNSSQESTKSDVHGTDIPQLASSHDPHTKPFWLHKVNGSRPKASYNLENPISTSLAPDLELTLAIPTTLEGSKPSSSNPLVHRPIRVI